MELYGKDAALLAIKRLTLILSSLIIADHRYVKGQLEVTIIPFTVAQKARAVPLSAHQGQVFCGNNVCACDLFMKPQVPLLSPEGKITV